MKTTYITTTLPYVNADPHIGFALEIVQADAWARAKRLIGETVIFNTGTDEHGTKIYEKAQKEGKDPQTYVDEYALKFKSLHQTLAIEFSNFIRTTNTHHKEAAQEFWRRCAKNDDIYKATYHVKYCVGCELAKTESELEDGLCPLHPNRELEMIEEENYFFRFSKYQDRLLELYKTNSSFVMPKHRLEEIRNFVASGLEDFSISRLKTKMPWGIPVPGDDSQVMYVWFDALINYISTLGWPRQLETFNNAWPGVQVAGKDNLRQQSAMWQAMLMSAGISPSRQIFIHGFISVNGQKISKSTGNVIDPMELVNTYGVDAVRYYLLREIPGLEDGDFSYERLSQLYNADLANELGNAVSRLTTLAATDGIENVVKVIEYPQVLLAHINDFQFHKALEHIWIDLKGLNKDINEVAPWKKDASERQSHLTKWLTKLYEIGFQLSPFMPETSKKIMDAVTGKIVKVAPLFPRLKG